MSFARGVHRFKLLDTSCTRPKETGKEQSELSLFYDVGMRLQFFYKIEEYMDYVWVYPPIQFDEKPTFELVEH